MAFFPENLFFSAFFTATENSNNSFRQVITHPQLVAPLEQIGAEILEDDVDIVISISPSYPE